MNMDFRTFPKLPMTNARSLLSDLSGKSVEEIRRASASSHAAARLDAGTAITSRDLTNMRNEINESFLIARLEAKPTGFGDSNFDRELGALLLENLPMSPYEAAHREVWFFLGLVVFPEIGAWRFPKLTPDRFIGPPLRNALGRTWWRAYLLGPDLGSGTFDAEPLGENELYALIEKTTIGLNPYLVQKMAAAIYRFQSKALGRDTIVEELTKDILRILPWCDLSAIEEEKLDALLDLRIIAASAAAALKPKGSRREPSE